MAPPSGKIKILLWIHNIALALIFDLGHPNLNYSTTTKNPQKFKKFLTKLQL